MSKYDLKKALTHELNSLNDTIDRKIIKGLPYTKEARRHRFISQSLAQIRQENHSSSNWFSRPFSLSFKLSPAR